jgi:hypothetical protein
LVLEAEGCDLRGREGWYLGSNPTDLARDESPPYTGHVLGEFGKRLSNNTLGKGLNGQTNDFVTRTACESHAYGVPSACARET